MNFQQVLSNLFSFGNSYEAIVFSIILVLTLIMGMIFNYLIFSGPAFRKKRKEISDLKSEIESLQAKNKLSEEKFTVQVSKAKRLEEEATKVQVIIDELNLKNDSYKKESAQLQFEKETLQRRAENAEKEINELKNLYKISQDENLENEEKISRLISEKHEAVSKFEELKNVLEEIEGERQNNEIVDDNTVKNAELRASSERLENEKEQLIAEISRLNLELHEKEKVILDSLKELSILKQTLIEQELKNKSTVQPQINENVSDESISVKTDSQQHELIIPLDREEPELKANDSSELSVLDSEVDSSLLAAEMPEIESEDSSIDIALREALLKEVLDFTGKSTSEQPENLKLISEIDANIESKLFALGIESYEQLSKLSDENVNQNLCRLLAIKDKTIDREQWAAQARQLLIKQKISNLTRDINLNKLFKK